MTFRAAMLLAALSILSASGQKLRLQPGENLAVDLAGTEESSWRLDVPDGQVVRVSFREQQGVAGILAVEDAKGSSVGRIDSTIRTPIAKNFTLAGGSYRITVRPSYHSPVVRKFEIEISASAPANLVDTQRATAEQLVGDGERIYRGYAPDHIVKAREKYEAALAIFEKLGDRARQADTLLHIANNVFEQGQMNAAVDLYTRALDLSKSIKDDQGIASALFGIGLVNGDNGQPQRSVELLRQSLDMRRSLGDVRGEAESLDFLALGLITLGQTQQGMETAEEGLKKSREAGERVREIDAESILGLGAFRAGDYAAAIEHDNSALALSKEENQPARAGTMLSNLGAAYVAIGDPRRALAAYEEALPLRKLEFPGSYANTIYHIGTTNAGLGNYQTALDDLNHALAIFRGEKYGLGESYTLLALANLFVDTGRDAQAREDLEESLEIARKGSDKHGVADALIRLGTIDARLGNDAKAIEEEKEGLESARAAGYMSEQASAMQSIAELMLDSGDTAGAMGQLQDALALTRKIGLRLSESNALNLEGQAFRRMGRMDEARQALTEAMEIRHRLGAASSEGETLLALAELEHASHHEADASRRATAALEIVESLRASFGDHQSRIAMASSHRRYYDLAIQIAMDAGNSSRALEISERARARGLLDLLAEARIDFLEGVDRALIERKRQTEELLDAKQERFLKLVDTPHSAARETAARREIDDLVDREAEIETRIRQASPASAALTQPRPISFAAIQKLLPQQGTALIEFWLGEEQSFAWVVSKTECRGFVLPPRAKLEAAARRAYQSISVRHDKPESSDAEKLRAILAPAFDAAANVRQWWIVADGALEYVPFAALADLHSSSPLVLRHEIVELPSASVLAEVREQIADRKPAPKTVAVFADPVFRADDPRVGHAAASASANPELTRALHESGVQSLERLHFSREEAEAIANLAPSAKRWIALDFEASRGAVEKPGLDRYRVVHFATHGLIDSRQPELSGIVLSMVDQAGHPEDGFLPLHEIYNLKLNADLVVLSACQTALGESVRSEGIVGLTRGFMYAGAPQVLATLWSVEDRATAEFMRRFYDALLRHNLPAAAALASAQRSMRNDQRWSDPYYWAAFVLQGTR